MSDRRKSARGRGKPASYPSLRSIDGRHPLQDAVTQAYLPYPAQARSGGRIYYFNFALAKEMGLIPRYHAEKMTASLSRAILDTFALQIVNEYDVLHGRNPASGKQKKHSYMATRYLQIQHPNKQGLTSGDGRSIWNGSFKSRHLHWDISSCGTGATRLSPATAIEKKFFKTGDKHVSYGCGLATVSEGLTSAISSDIFHRNGIATERCLLVIGFKDGTVINVRAHPNLLRPAHFFGLLRRSLYQPLRDLTDYYIAREMENGHFPRLRDAKQRYELLLERLCDIFAHTAAVFESEYIFCWLDWDGDNILMDGAIIDYGSIRQFGLFHHEYRYTDVDKMSTTITEQKNKAKHIVKTFAQMVDYLQTGEKRPLADFNRHPILKRFDEAFQRCLLQRLLHRMGYDQNRQKRLMADDEARLCLSQFQKKFRYFEKAVSRRRHYHTADGITRDAVFCMRDLLRELPARLLTSGKIFSADEFIELVVSHYASAADIRIYKAKKRQIRELQTCYRRLLEHCCRLENVGMAALLEKLARRSALINRYERTTGDSMIHVGARFSRERNQVSFEQLQAAIEAFVQGQLLNPDGEQRLKAPILRSGKLKRLMHWSENTVKDHREGI